MKMSLDSFLLGCFLAISSQKWNYEIKYMNSLVVPIMFKNFILENNNGDVSPYYPVNPEPTQVSCPIFHRHVPPLCPEPWIHTLDVVIKV